MPELSARRRLANRGRRLGFFLRGMRCAPRRQVSRQTHRELRAVVTKTELPPNEWTPVVGSLSLEVLNGTCTSVVY